MPSEQKPTPILAPRRNRPAPIKQVRTVDAPAGYLAVGLVVGVHGLRGELKVELHTDFPERFAAGSHLWIGETLQERKVVSARLHKNYLLLLLQGINQRALAEALRGQWLFVSEAEAVALDADSYWVHDIVGLTVQTEEGRELGEIVEVIFTGANDVYVISPALGVNQGKELLLPAISQVIRAVDLEANRMTVTLLPGLLEE